MLKPGADLYIRVAQIDGEARILHRSLVLESTAQRISAVPEASSPALSVDDEVILYFNEGSDFVQQTARVAELEELGSSIAIRYQTTSDPVSAESRENFRVTTVTANARLQIENEGAVPVRDVSVTGFAIVTSSQHSIGETLNVVLQYRNERYEGPASVQSIRELGPTIIRYGLRLIGDGNASLKAGLHTLTMETQRHQLARTQ